MTILSTERTIVTRITLEHAPFFVTLVNSPDWLRYIGDRKVENVEDAKYYLQSGFLQSYREHKFGYYLVSTLESEPIGICGFLKKPGIENIDFGFALLPEYFGRGLGFEAAKGVLDYGVEAFSFTVLDAVTRPNNARSIRLLEKLGFQRQGPHRQEGLEDLDLYRYWKC